MYDPILFAEKFRLAVESAVANQSGGGLCGFELEFNLLDSNFQPLRTVGSGPSQQSFVDYLRTECLPPWLRQFSQLEVFHWMIEWATRPYFKPRSAVYEGRLMEGVLLNALDQAGREFNQRLYHWPGSLPYLTQVGHDSIPGSWHLAKRRYLERCVDMYGETLAVAGTHSNLSLPEPLLALDFMHLSSTERADKHLDEYKSNFYITASRLMRAFAALFVATSAATPLQSQVRNGQQVVVLTDYDSTRNLTFPNPTTLDVPDLYRSYDDYLHISYDLVRRGVRFGNNNWTPVRARSFAEPVERLIKVTSEQLQDIYARGLYAEGQDSSVEEMAHQIENQNLMARINLPMARVEVRTDDGGQPLEVEIANLTLKHLLMARFYADPTFARAFRYDAEDISRARRNELAAAQRGLDAEIENPFSAKPAGMRDFLHWTLDELQPLAEALDLWEDLSPLVEMAAGAPNPAGRLREALHGHLENGDEVPPELLRDLADQRKRDVCRDIEMIAETYPGLNGEGGHLGEFLQHARDEVHLHPQAPVRFRPRPEAVLDVTYPDKTSEVLALARPLIRIPSVTACPDERLDDVRRAATFLFDYVRNRGLEVRYYDQEKYPALLVGFPGQLLAPVMLSGHFDVVSPEPDESQFEPRIEGDYLWGRGSADMKTVVATYLVWMKDTLRAGPPYPPVNLLLVGNEENGEGEPMGTPHVLRQLANGSGMDGAYAPRLFIAGERTGERGNELWGEICTQNRGVARFDVVARGQRGHTGVAGAGADPAERLFQARGAVQEILERHLTLHGPDGWKSQVRFPFIHVGTSGVYNIIADYGRMGVEVRPIPQDDLGTALDELRAYAEAQGLELQVQAMEDGVACDESNPYLQALLSGVESASGGKPVVSRKLAGTSARFAPAGQGVVWGQSGIGPHARDERHYIPSILPYYRALEAFAAELNKPVIG